MSINVMANRRGAPRYPLILVAEITEVPSGTKLHARTSDVSRTGCYVDTLKPFPKGVRVNLRLIRGREVFETGAQVVYVSPGLGMGIHFDEQSAAKQLGTLDRWLSEAAKNI
ncbi:MAG: PilZ domain-containing protein [Candidatus Acidiferrum sp.]|jgi:hypothetical protein